MNKLHSYLIVFLFSRLASAEVLNLPTLETTNTDPIFSTMASAFAFRSVEGASDLGSKWGFSVGLGVNGTDASGLTESGGTTQSGYVPGGELQIAIGLPKGITIEAGFVPSFDYQETNISKAGGAIKWTLNRSILSKFPALVALRLSYAQSSIGYVQTSGGGTLDVDYETSVFGANVLISKFVGAASFGIEPYLGAGLATHSSLLRATGAGDMFGTTFPAGTESIDGSSLSAWLQAGLMLKLGFIAISGEYTNLFGVSSYGGKVSLRI